MDAAGAVEADLGPLTAVARSAALEQENESYVIATDWTAIAITGLVIIASIVALVLALRYLRSRRAR